MTTAASPKLLGVPTAGDESGGASSETNSPPLTAEAVYETHFDRVWRNLRRLGVEEAALEDAAQDVFVTVFRKFDSWDRSRCTVDTWVFGILRKVASRYRRGSKRRLMRFFPWTSDAVEQAPSPKGSPAEAMEKRESSELLEALLASIDPKKRELVLLVDVEQLSVVEAAEALGINLNTAYSRLRSGRELFSSALRRHRAALDHFDAARGRAAREARRGANGGKA